MRLAWRTVLALSTVGVVVGGLSLFGLWPPWAEVLVWGATALLLVGPVLLRTRAPNPFLSAVLVYGIAGALTGGIQALFAETYAENHPDMAGQLRGAGPLEVAAILLVSSTVAGLVFGALAGLGTWLLARRRAASEPREAAG